MSSRAETSFYLRNTHLLTSASTRWKTRAQRQVGVQLSCVCAFFVGEKGMCIHQGPERATYLNDLRSIEMVYQFLFQYRTASERTPQYYSLYETISPLQSHNQPNCCNSPSFLCYLRSVDRQHAALDGSFFQQHMSKHDSSINVFGFKSVVCLFCKIHSISKGRFNF